jgi:large repetitive protein
VLTADPQSIALLDGATPLALGAYTLGTALRAGGPPLEICVDEGDAACTSRGELVSSRVGADLVAGFGLGRAALYLQLPIVLHQGSDFDVADAQLAASGVGDVRIGGRLGLVANRRGAIALDAKATVPTGQGDDFTGDGGATAEGRVILEHRADRLRAVLQLGYGWRQEPARLGNLYIADEALWAIGAEYALTPDRFSVGLAAFGRIGLTSDPMAIDSMNGPSDEERPAELLASARYWATPSLAFEAGGGTALTDGYGALSFRALVGVRWFHDVPPPPPDLDWDDDGILNADDECPRDPEDADGFEDADGCPDPDNDHDQVLDRDDACPLDPEDRDGFEDTDGCAEKDNDHDGIVDDQDACPLEPEDLDAFEDTDGCPELDNDKDGIVDTSDACPLDPEDLDGFEDTDGCPEPDNDKDGLLDTVDQCPNEAETYNGHDDADGCPDTPPTVQLTDTHIEIKDTIYFETNKAAIQARSHELLDGVAAVMKAHGTLRIRVEGHTDDRAADDYNLGLSQRRAEAVRAYLVEQGIAADRLEAVGYGETRPKMAGKSKAARDANRRVEFVILEQPSSETPADAPSATP